MLRKTFLHLHGIGTKTEKKLWQNQIRDWGALEEALSAGLLKGERFVPTLKEELHRSREHLERRDLLYFTEKMPSNQHWRLFADFASTAAYLDIETTGLGGPSDHITTISLYDGEALRYYIWGENLQEFITEIKNYELLITYNGKSFDLPFIEWQFNIRIDRAHLDLRYVLNALGYRGGLKGCEKQLGISRGDLEGVDGYMAVLLWQEYQRSGDARALETLLAYNIEDTINLQKLAYCAYNEALKQTPFASQGQLDLPPSKAEVPFQPSPAVLQKLQDRLARGSSRRFIRP